MVPTEIDPPKETLSVTEAAKFIGVSRQTLYRAIKLKKVRVSRLGLGSLRILKSDLYDSFE